MDLVKIRKKEDMSPEQRERNIWIHFELKKDHWYQFPMPIVATIINTGEQFDVYYARYCYFDTSRECHIFECYHKNQPVLLPIFLPNSAPILATEDDLENLGMRQPDSLLPEQSEPEKMTKVVETKVGPTKWLIEKAINLFHRFKKN